tara:strand:+ start:2373 stop:2582 length:210 start_codon:yes stop_codon:yes gene_type:complete
MRIINIITNELILKKQKLEHELERTLNSINEPTEKQIKTSIELVNKLSEVTQSIAIWESYNSINKENKK